MNATTKATEVNEITETEAWLGSLEPTTAVVSDPVELRRIGLAQRAITTSTEELRAAVADARDAGYSWSRIAMTLGVTRQAAQIRFGRN